MSLSVNMNTSADDNSEQENLMALRRVLEGRSLVVSGGAWTAEAWEPERNSKLHAQLRLARQLRVTMENAADLAEQNLNSCPPRKLLVELIPSINELVSLTEAVRGHYTLDDYHEYTRLLKEEEDTQNKELARGTETIVRQLLETTRNKEFPPNQSNHIPAATAAAPSNILPSGHFAIDFDLNEPTRKASPSSSHIPVVMKSSLKRKSHEVSSRSTPKRRSVLPRRCHDCKSSSTRFRRCQFWLLTGSKCGKTFCSSCLEVRYGEATMQDSEFDESSHDWNCPSCQGSCLCSDCVKSRKKALNSATDSMIQRRSSR